MENVENKIVETKEIDELNDTEEEIIKDNPDNLPGNIQEQTAVIGNDLVNEPVVKEKEMDRNGVNDNERITVNDTEVAAKDPENEEKKTEKTKSKTKDKRNKPSRSLRSKTSTSNTQ